MTTPLPTTAELRSLLACWLEDAVLADCQIHEAAGGLSGARIWQVIVGEQKLCLRRWPTVYPSPEKLAAIHRLIEHVDCRGLNVVPVPLRSRKGDTLMFAQEHLWELALWLPGVAVAPPDVMPEVLGTAGAILARFHLATADFSVDDHSPGLGRAPGLLNRLCLLEELRNGQLALLRKQVATKCKHPHHQLAIKMLDAIEASLDRVLSTVSAASTMEYPLQWCLRDVHREHLLFSEGEITGLIDFGAAAVDSVAGDIARLAGSLAGESATSWKTFLTSYEQLRPLSTEERQAIAAYDTGGTICAAANWLCWLFVEARNFANQDVVAARLAELVKKGEGGRGKAELASQK